MASGLVAPDHNLRHAEKPVLRPYYTRIFLAGNMGESDIGNTYGIFPFVYPVNYFSGLPA